ncbi:MAG: phospholipase [Blastochloris sp.]|nr:phospholipase [Blastochloris sp.]
MQLMMGGINGNYLTNITLNAAAETQEVLAAVAYATEMDILFDWCWNNGIPLKYYGRLDEGVPVKPSILSAFLARKSARFQCRLVQHHHAKVIWWREYGLYIGSANLTASAWYKNVEAGCFFPEAEITDEMAEDILELFDVLDRNSTPLTDELLEVMHKRAKQIARSEPPSEEFWNSPSFNKWSGLVQTGKKKATDRRREAFLEEWHSTLQQLRDIGNLVSKPENRPSWIDGDAPAGAQGDQFLHAHYYQRTFDGRRALYADHFEQNKQNPDAALADAIKWWRNLPKAPSEEDVMLNSTAPMLREALTAEAIDDMDYEAFREICMGIHSIKDYARRVANKAVGLREDGTTYTIPEKVDALSKRIWGDKSAGGNDVKQLLKFILYGGSEAQLPERLWTAFHDPKWKIEGLGVSALGELVGWALPDRFPPRNGRTSKSLKSLGYDVTVHVG